MTLYTAKVLLAVPASLLAGTRTWVAANIDAEGGARWFALPLSASGSAPPTHHAACFHATVPELKLLIGRLLTLTTGVSDPRSQWDGWTRAERVTWWGTLRDALRVQRAVYCRLAWNDLGERPDDAAEFLLGNLKPIAG